MNAIVKPESSIPHALSEDVAYQDAILQDVSRTFALTIPQLPERLRLVVGNAYLLCRIADTIEDATAIPIEEKVQFSQEFVRVVAGETSAEAFADGLAPRLTTGASDAERDLIANSPRAIRITHSFSEAERAALTRCVRIMSEGMDEFQEGRFTDGLRDLPHLDAYCYHVAGVVGEMLTDLFCAYSPEVAARRDEMQKLAVSFGQGLQMTNILKDIWDDRKRGVCWLPQSIFNETGFDLTKLEHGPNDPAYREGIQRLVAVTLHHLENALEYTLLLPKSETGIRRFCLWAIGMAVLTIRKIHRHPGFTAGNQVKITRRTVYATILVSNSACQSNALLRLIFKACAMGLPKIHSKS
ncbi:MAG: phytoene/squalene synthase family protein [Candidatus Hydrogenedentes bacterium]|nr:phytoene/squalene synthase family protein [Candidatus Hydrogenedentota bacterium]